MAKEIGGLAEQIKDAAGNKGFERRMDDLAVELKIE